MEEFSQGRGEVSLQGYVFIWKHLEKLLITVKCLSHCTLSLDQNTAQQCLILNFWFPWPLGFVRLSCLIFWGYHFHVRKSAGKRVVWCSDYKGCMFLVLNFGCQSLCAVPSTTGAKFYLAWFATAAMIKQISYVDSFSWLGFIWVFFNCPFHFIVEDEF